MILVCAKCCISKPEDAFHRSTKEKSGRKSQCKTCRSRATNKPPKIIPEKQVCKKCGIEQPLADFSPNTEMANGHLSACKSCRAESQRNNEAHREYRKRWRKSNKDKHAISEQRRRAAKANTVMRLTAAQWQTIKAMYDYRCVYCGRKMKRLTMDHITPVIAGGPTVLENIVPACIKCNSKKHTGPPLVPVQPLLLLP